MVDGFHLALVDRLALQCDERPAVRRFDLRNLWKGHVAGVQTGAREHRAEGE